MDPRSGVVIFGSVLGAIGLLLLLWARSMRKRRRLYADTPTSNIRSMPVGWVEVKATAQVPPGARPFVSRFKNAPCLAWSYSLQERRTRKTKNGTRHYWHTLESGGQSAPFALQDATGICMLDPGPETIPMPGRFVASRPEDLPQAAALLKRGVFDPPRRLLEQWLPIGTALFVQGTAQRPAGAQGIGNAALVISKPADRPFTISTGDEASVTRVLGIASWVVGILGLGVFTAGMLVIGFATGIAGGNPT